MGPMALFGGCLIPYREPGFEQAARTLLHHLGVEIVDLEFNCCGARMLESASDSGWLTLSARNLALAEKHSLPILALCGSCTGTMARAINRLADPETRAEVNRLLSPPGLSYEGKTKIQHLTGFLCSDDILPRLQVVNPVFKSVKAALSVPCQVVRPNDSATLGADAIVDLVRRFVGEVVVIPQCCGATYAAMDPVAGDGMLADNVAFAAEQGCDIIVSACGNCQFAYDYSQATLARRGGIVKTIPSVNIAQLVGLSLGLDPKALALNRNRIKPKIGA